MGTIIVLKTLCENRITNINNSMTMGDAGKITHAMVSKFFPEARPSSISTPMIEAVSEKILHLYGVWVIEKGQGGENLLEGAISDWLEERGTIVAYVNVRESTFGRTIVSVSATFPTNEYGLKEAASFRMFLSEATEDEFIAKLLTNPADYTSWSIFADWLEERGDPRAELIRGLVQLSKRDALKRKKNVAVAARVDELGNPHSINYEFRMLLYRAFPVFAQANQLGRTHGSRSNGVGMAGLIKIQNIIAEPRYRERVSDALQQINTILGGHGVEAIHSEHHWDNYTTDIVAEYVNMGDTYDLTVLYDWVKGRFYITSWGDWYERNENLFQDED